MCPFRPRENSCAGKHSWAVGFDSVPGPVFGVFDGVLTVATIFYCGG